MTREVACPLIGSGKIRCNCSEPGTIDLDWKVRANRKRSLEMRIEMLRRFRNRESTLKVMAAEQGVSIRMVHGVIHATAADVMRICASKKVLSGNAEQHKLKITSKKDEGVSR